MKFLRRMDTKHLSFVLLHYRYPRVKETETDCDAEEKSPLILIPYVGVSEDIRRVSQLYYSSLVNHDQFSQGDKLR